MTNLYSKLSKFFLYLVPFTVIIVSRGTLFPFIVGKYVFFRVVVELALISFLWAWVRGETLINADKNKKSASISRNQHQSALWLQPLVIAVSVFVLIFLLAGFLGYNPSASFWSNFERGEGGLQMLHLFIFFILLVLLFKDEKAWRKMFVVSLWAAGLVITYGLAAALKISGFIGPGFCERVAGSLGNSAYLGTFMLFALFYASYLFAIEYQHKSASYKKWVLGGLPVLFFVFFVLSQTRGAFLGLGVAVIVGLLYLFFHLPAGWFRKITLISVVILIISGGVAFKFRQSINLIPFCSGSNRLLDFSVKTESFQTRLFLWEQSIKIFKERPILGWGPENFSPAFEKHYDYRLTVWFDRAHNIFFDYLTTTGILGFLSYLSIFVVFYWQFFKKTLINADKKPINADNQHKSAKNPCLPAGRSINPCLLQNALLFALPIAYLVQGLVLFEVLPIYISLFLFLAFANYKFNNKL